MTIHTDRLTTALDSNLLDCSDSPAERIPFDGSIPRAAVRRVLGNDRRRETLRRLLEEDAPLELSTLVALIADAEHDATAVTPLHDRRQRVHVSLCRTHLPLLETYRILSYDRERGLVVPGARLSLFESVLERAPLK